MYRQTRDGEVLNDDLGNFPQCTNPDNLVDPFLQQMSAVQGCTDSTVELLMKFYRADSQAKIKQYKSKAKQAGVKEAVTTEDEHARMRTYTLIHMKKELDEAKLFRFARQVDEIYRQSYLSHYSDFSRVSEFLVHRKDIVHLYQTFRDTFPMCHSIFSMIVSSSRYRVQLASVFANEDSTTTPDVVSAGEENDVPHGDADVPDDNTES